MKTQGYAVLVLTKVGDKSSLQESIVVYGRTGPDSFMEAAQLAARASLDKGIVKSMVFELKSGKAILVSSTYGADAGLESTDSPSDYGKRIVAAIELSEQYRLIHMA